MFSVIIFSGRSQMFLSTDELCQRRIESSQEIGIGFTEPNPNPLLGLVWHCCRISQFNFATALVNKMLPAHNVISDGIGATC